MGSLCSLTSTCNPLVSSRRYLGGISGLPRPGSTSARTLAPWPLRFVTCNLYPMGSQHGPVAFAVGRKAERSVGADLAARQGAIFRLEQHAAEFQRLALVEHLALDRRGRQAFLAAAGSAASTATTHNVRQGGAMPTLVVGMFPVGHRVSHAHDKRGHGTLLVARQSHGSWTLSPPLHVASRWYVRKLMVSLRNCTLPSAMAKLQPPGCQLPIGK